MERGLTGAEKEIIQIRATMAKCGGSFEYQVRELQDAGITTGRAVKYIAAKYPTAHADYLKRAAKGQAGSLIGGTRNV
jgi:hypothetical protein